MPIAVTVRQVSVEQVRRTVDRGAYGLFTDEQMAAMVEYALNRAVTPARQQVRIEHGDQLLLAQPNDGAESTPRGPRVRFYEVRIAR
jgi:hypothetical protein